MTKDTRIVILGGRGFIGGHLAQRLASLGYNCDLFCRPSIGSTGNQTMPGVNYIYGDFSSKSDVARALDGATVVFHLIGNTVPASSNRDPHFDIESNLLPTISLLEMCAQKKVEQVIFASSGGAVYGVPEQVPIDEYHPTFPICSYGIQKLAVEHYMRVIGTAAGVKMTVLRIANPYGPRQSVKRSQGVIAAFCHCIKMRKPLSIWGDGSVIRDYIHILDVVEAMAAVIELPDSYSVFNIGSEIGTSLRQLTELLIELTPSTYDVEYSPARSVDVPANVLSTTKFRTRFDWEPKWNIKDGLANTLSWYLNNDDY